jgi:hypothetical protein
MRCLSCNVLLTDYEATVTSAFTGDYLDICNSCFKKVAMSIETNDRPDLRHDEEVEQDWIYVLTDGNIDDEDFDNNH